MTRAPWWLAAAVGLAACAPAPANAPPPGPQAPSVPAGFRPYRLQAIGPLAIAEVTVDSETAGYGRARIIDKNLSTEWTNGGYRNATSWATLQLTASASLTSVGLKTGPSPSGTRYDLQVSSDGVNWTTALASQTHTTWNLETKTLPIGTQGRFVRIFWRNSATAPQAHFSIYEVVINGTATASPAPSPSVTPTPTPSVSPTPLPSASPGGGAPLPVRRLSVAGQAIASSGNALGAVDGSPTSIWAPTGSLPQWLAVPLATPASGPLLVQWHSGGYHYLNTGYGPRNYLLQASSDSTDGRNGSWTTVRTVTDNPVRSRIDTVQAPGARWLRFLVTARWGTGPNIRELEVHTASGPTPLDAWLILGDSITAQSFDPGKLNNFSPKVQALTGTHRPLLIGAGTGGDTAGEGLNKLAVGLPLSPAGSFVGLAYGTNDATRGVPVATFKAQLQQMIDRIKASGRTPMLARTPWNLNGTLPNYVAAIDQVRAANDLPPGPDLYTWFKNHPGELRSDRVHPTATGEQSIQRLWAEAVANAYR